MIQKLQNFAAKITEALANGWQQLPTWAQKALRDGATAFIIMIALSYSTLNLVFPHSISEARAEGLLLWANLIGPAVYAFVAVFRTEFLPPLWDAILRKLNLFKTTVVGDSTITLQQIQTDEQGNKAITV